MERAANDHDLAIRAGACHALPMARVAILAHRACRLRAPQRDNPLRLLARAA
jgi:hypothetical protein